MNADELGRILAKAKHRGERNLWLGAILGGQIRSEIVIVGGSAIEVYTSGRYVSGDVDLVGERRRIIEAVEGWGFRREGRLWSRPDFELWIDPVGGHYTGEVRRLRQVSTPYGLVRLASVEDLIAKRLIETKVWPREDRELFEQAVALAAEYQEEIDWEYVARVARRDGAEDLVPELRRRIAEPADGMKGPQPPRTATSGWREGRGR